MSQPQMVAQKWRNSPIDIDVEGLDDLVIGIVSRALVDVGAATAHHHATAMEFFEGGQFDRFCDALNVSSESRKRILALVAERAAGVRRLCSNRTRVRLDRC